MKTLIVTLSLVFAGSAMAQLAPQASPGSKLEQRVGLTDITVKYSRPSKNDRTIFGDLVPYGKVWRTGANENTVFTCNDVLVFGKDSLKAGSYSLYTKPNKDSWDLIFYKTTDNWGNPENWEEANVVLTTSAKTASSSSTVESFTIAINDLKNEGATLQLSWDKTVVNFPFVVLTDKKVMANINKVMAGPSANDYYSSANYYYTTGKDLKLASEWCKKALDANPEAFWIALLMAKIQTKQGLKKEAIATAEKGKAIAEKTTYTEYVKEFEGIIKENSK